MRMEVVAPFLIFVTVADKNLVSRHFVPLCAVHNLVPNPLHIFEENLLTAAVIKFGGSAVCVAGDSLSGFKGAVIFQKIRDAGRSE
jgi:hypothetical protein